MNEVIRLKYKPYKETNAYMTIPLNNIECTIWNDIYVSVTMKNGQIITLKCKTYLKAGEIYDIISKIIPYQKEHMEIESVTFE